MALFDIVQTASIGFDGTSESLVFGSNVTNGNTVVLFIVGRSGDAESAITEPSGFSNVLDQGVELADADARRWTYGYAKQVNGTEGTTFACSWTSSTNGAILGIEIEGQVELDKSAKADSGTGQSNSQSTGTTATTTAANEIILAVMGIRHRNIGTVSWTNSVVLQEQADGTGTGSAANKGAGAFGAKTVSSAATYESTASWTASDECHAAILTFKETSTGDATATPASVSAPVGVPAVTVTASATRSATAVAAPVAVPQPTVTGGTAVAATAVAAPTAVPQATVSAGSTVAAASVDAPASVPLPSVTGSGDGAVIPGPVDAPAAVPSAAATGSVTVAATSVDAPAAVPQPTVTASVEKALAAVTANTGIPLASLTASVNVAAATINIVAAVPLVTLLSGVELQIGTALGFAQFHRINGNLVLSPIGHGTRIGFATSEGFERASDVFRIDNHPGGEATREYAMEAVLAVWTANKAAAIATLKTAIHSALDGAGFRAGDSSRLP